MMMFDGELKGPPDDMEGEQGQIWRTKSSPSSRAQAATAGDGESIADTIINPCYTQGGLQG